jgi:predicted dehydrogenase
MIKRVLIVGLGSIGKRHLRLTRKLLPKANIRILRHQPQVNIPEFSDGVFNNNEEAIKFKPDLAIISSPSSKHLELALPLASEGIHMLIEKPLANTSTNLQDLLHVADKNKCVIAVGYNLRFLRSLIFFRELITKDKIGRILSVHCEAGQFLPSWRPDSDYSKSVSANKYLGGGVLLELSHELDYLSWIFGKVEWVKSSVSSVSDLEVDVEDSANIILGFSSEDPQKQVVASLSLDFLRHDSTRTCIAIGAHGTLRWNGISNTVEIFEAGSSKWQTLFNDISEQDETYTLELKNIIECIIYNKKPKVTLEDGATIVKIVEAIESSAKTHQRIGIPSIGYMLGDQA